MNLAEMLAKIDDAVKDVDVNATTEFKPLPPGDYNVVIVKADEPVPTQTPNPANPNEFGQRINIQFKVLDGQYENRRLFTSNNLTVYPKSLSEDDRKKALMAMAIGSKERKIWLASIGKVAIEKAAELVGATCKVSVIVEKSDTTGKDKNRVRKVMPMGGASSTPVASAPTSAPASSAKPAAKKMPWEV